MLSPVANNSTLKLPRCCQLPTMSALCPLEEMIILTLKKSKHDINPLLKCPATPVRLLFCWCDCPRRQSEMHEFSYYAARSGTNWGGMCVGGRVVRWEEATDCHQSARSTLYCGERVALASFLTRYLQFVEQQGSKESGMFIEPMVLRYNNFLLHLHCMILFFLLI